MGPLAWFPPETPFASENNICDFAIPKSNRINKIANIYEGSRTRGAKELDIAKCIRLIEEIEGAARVHQ